MPAKVERIEVSCATCGKTKKILPSQVRPNGLYFCNRECRGKWQSKHYHGSGNPHWNSIEVECAFCGKKKFINLERFERTENFFCNTKCQANWRKIHWKGKDCPLSVERVEVYCAWCGKPKYVIPYLLTINDRFFCDGKCHGLYKSKFESKENHGMWKGGISFELYGLEFNSELKHQIKRRDGYACQLCDEGGNNDILHVHHIDYDKRNNDPSNLITLCNSCHSKTNTNRESWLFYFQRLQ